MGSHPEPACNPLLERAHTLDAYDASEGTSSPFAFVPVRQSSGTLGLNGLKPVAVAADRAKSGLLVNDLFKLTDDPKVQKRLLSADTDHDGRISRRDVLNVLKSEVAAKVHLRHGLAAGAALLAFCFFALLANAALTFAVVKMSQETRLNSGKLTDWTGARVVGTAQSAGMADLRWAHHATSPGAATALLSLKELLVQDDSGASAAYRVLSASAVPGQHLEFVVAAPTAGSDAAADDPAAWDPASPAVELIRIAVTDAGVHEVRGGGAASGARRRSLLVSGSKSGSIRGVVYDVTSTAGSCSPSATSCPSAANLIGCPLLPTCGADGVLYGGPCEAAAGGWSVACVFCGPVCPGASTKPAGTGPAAVRGGVDARDPAWVKTVPAATTGSGLANPQFRKTTTSAGSSPLAQVKAAVVLSPPSAAATTPRKARQN